MLHTRTGNFPIGFRRGWGDWQADLGSLSNWATQNGLSVIDLGKDGPASVEQAVGAGLRIGSVDALDWGALMSSDAGKRADTVAKNREYIAANAKAGAKNFFICLVPENPALERKENFSYAVESLAALAPTFEENGARMVIEGYPGAGAVACAPEGVRQLLKEVPSKGIALNYDPSHLIRMNIDHLRFLKEFVTHVGHVHGKDTEVMTDSFYEFGTEQPVTFAPRVGWQGAFWRYTIPGHGIANWVEIFRILQENGYDGAVSIELEDANFCDTDEGQQQGILTGAQFLTGC